MASEEINLVAILYPKPEKADELSAALAELTQQVQANEPDTLLYFAFASAEKKDEVYVVERGVDKADDDDYRYRNAAALQTHAQGPHFQAFASKAPGLMAKPFEIKKGGGILPASVGVARL